MSENPFNNHRETPRDEARPRPPLPLESLRPVVVAPESPVRALDLDSVRERLGLSRREVLAAGGAALVAPPEALAARQERYQELGLSPEAQAYYESILGQLRESARSSDSEVARLFIARPDGTFSFVSPTQEETLPVAGNEHGAALLHMPDTHYIDVRDRSLTEGAIVIDQHTHPTKAFERMAQDGNEALRGRVPPSPTDVLGSVWVGARLPDEETHGRYRREVVTEQGVWRYGPISREAAIRLSESLDAGDRVLRRLDTRYRVEGRALGAYVTELTDRGHLPEQFRMMVEPLTQGRFGALLAGDPAAVAALVQLSDLASINGFPRPSREARSYLREVERANRMVQGALSAVSGSREQNHLEQPYLTEEQLAAYQERWRRLGVQMTFRPFGNESER